MYFAIQKLPEIDCDCFNLMVGLLDFSPSYYTFIVVVAVLASTHFKCIENISQKFSIRYTYIGGTRRHINTQNW